MELTLDQALQKGVEAHKAGQIQNADKFYTAILKAQPKHPDANHNMGVLSVGVGKVQEALPFFKTALEANPNIGQYWLSYVNSLIELGKLDDAVVVFNQAKDKGAKGEEFDQIEKQLSELSVNEAQQQDPDSDPPLEQLQPIVSLYAQGQLQQALSEIGQMLERFPNSVDLYNISGACNAGLMQFDAAINNYKQAIDIKPNYADPYYNMGIALKDMGDPEAAIVSFKQALKIKSDYAHAYNNMGVALKDTGDPEAAIVSFKQALKIKPNYAEAYHNIGITLNDKGDLEAAIDSYKKALKINPNYSTAYYNMATALKGVKFAQPNPDLQAIITSILNLKTYARPGDISQAAMSLLKFEPAIKKLLEKHSTGEVKQSLVKLISTLSEVPLLLKLMSVCPLSDLALEDVLTGIRSALLSSVSVVTYSPEVLRFQSVLALQCFTNEYIYNQNNREVKGLAVLEAVVKTILLKGEQPTSQSILCLATYKALHEYEWWGLLTVTAGIDEVFTRQILEPKEEIHLKSDMPVLQEITDKVSSKVREQYEENPYPRWVNTKLRLDPARISKITKEIKLRLFDKLINDVLTPNILIAGCGTGQHSIGTASRFKNAQVLAVDLSLSSLAYAKRKTEELGLQNIDHMQADILDLGKLGRAFDIIESVGVLHHMDDPMAGWRVLTDCLKPGGLMRIGLYSELARQHIVRIREEISQSGIGSSDLAMRSFRSTAVKSQEAHHKLILQSPDFYSLSPLMDLLFHVQEHRFTIPQIQKCLDELGLKFCGFGENKTVQNFKLTNTGADDPYDLDKWNTYEEANPRAFAGMYQFWCQKVV